MLLVFLIFTHRTRSNSLCLCANVSMPFRGGGSGSGSGGGVRTYSEAGGHCEVHDETLPESADNGSDVGHCKRCVLS